MSTAKPDYATIKRALKKRTADLKASKATVATLEKKQQVLLEAVGELSWRLAAAEETTRLGLADREAADLRWANLRDEVAAEHAAQLLHLEGVAEKERRATAEVEGELHTARGEIARLDAEMKEATASQDARAASLDARLRSATQRALDADATIERLIGELEEERQKVETGDAEIANWKRKFQQEARKRQRAERLSSRLTVQAEHDTEQIAELSARVERVERAHALLLDEVRNGRHASAASPRSPSVGTDAAGSVSDVGEDSTNDGGLETLDVSRLQLSPRKSLSPRQRAHARVVQEYGSSKPEIDVELANARREIVHLKRAAEEREATIAELELSERRYERLLDAEASEKLMVSIKNRDLLERVNELRHEARSAVAQVAELREWKERHEAYTLEQTQLIELSPRSRYARVPQMPAGPPGALTPSPPSGRRRRRRTPRRSPAEPTTKTIALPAIATVGDAAANDTSSSSIFVTESMPDVSAPQQAAGGADVPAR